MWVSINSPWSFWIIQILMHNVVLWLADILFCHDLSDNISLSSCQATTAFCVPPEIQSDCTFKRWLASSQSAGRYSLSRIFSRYFPATTLEKCRKRVYMQENACCRSEHDNNFVAANVIFSACAFFLFMSRIYGDRFLPLKGHIWSDLDMSLSCSYMSAIAESVYGGLNRIWCDGCNSQKASPQHKHTHILFNCGPQNRYFLSTSRLLSCKYNCYADFPSGSVGL